MQRIQRKVRFRGLPRHLSPTQGWEYAHARHISCENVKGQASGSKGQGPIREPDRQLATNAGLLTLAVYEVLGEGGGGGGVAWCDICSDWQHDMISD